MKTTDPKNDKLWQYEVIHKKTTDFKLGDAVFLKASPERPMKVRSIGEKNIIVSWTGLDGKGHMHSFPPQYLLQYAYAGLMVDNTGSYRVCLN